ATARQRRGRFDQGRGLGRGSAVDERETVAGRDREHVERAGLQQMEVAAELKRLGCWRLCEKRARAEQAERRAGCDSPGRLQHLATRTDRHFGSGGRRTGVPGSAGGSVPSKPSNQSRSPRADPISALPAEYASTYCLPPRSNVLAPACMPAPV